jgi:hypothetical protein
MDLLITVKLVPLTESNLILVVVQMVLMIPKLPPAHNVTNSVKHVLPVLPTVSHVLQEEDQLQNVQFSHQRPNLLKSLISQSPLPKFSIVTKNVKDVLKPLLNVPNVLLTELCQLVNVLLNSMKTLTETVLLVLTDVLPVKTLPPNVLNVLVTDHKKTNLTVTVLMVTMMMVQALIVKNVTINAKPVKKLINVKYVTLTDLYQTVNVLLVCLKIQTKSVNHVTINVKNVTPTPNNVMNVKVPTETNHPLVPVNQVTMTKVTAKPIVSNVPLNVQLVTKMVVSLVVETEPMLPPDVNVERTSITPTNALVTNVTINVLIVTNPPNVLNVLVTD